MAERVTIERLAEWLRKRDEIVLLGHVNPDGDAAGCCMALCLALRALGKRAAVCLPGGPLKIYEGVIPGNAEALDPGDALPFAPKTALAVDVSEHARLGEAGARLFDGCACRAALDHHGTNPGFGEIYCLDGGAAATGELAVELIEAMGVELSREMADGLFVAISTDCGNFNFPNTTPRTLRAAARCVEAGAAVDELTRKLYRDRSLAQTRLSGLILSGLELSPDGKLAWSRLTRAMLREAGADWADNVNIVNYLVQIHGVRVAVLAEERESGHTKFSLRSNPPFDVARGVAVPLGGGGHSCAAGVTLDMELEPALQRVLATARDALDTSEHE